MLVGTALLLTYLLLMIFGGCADKLILFPTTNQLNPAGAVRRAIEHNGQTIELWTGRSPAAHQREPELYMLEFTGNATRAEEIAMWVASRWNDRAVEAWVMNYPGYGGSTGPARLRDIPAAALASFDAIKQHAGDKPIVLAGNSLGTTAALHVAANRQCRGMILQSPVPLRRVILRDFGWWNLWLGAGPIALAVPSELNAIENARRVKAPAIFITADADTLIRPTHQQAVIDAYAGDKRVITLHGMGHNDTITTSAEMEEFHQALNWLVPR